MDDSNLTQDACIKMLNTFRCSDLKVLLKGFARITYKKKEELISRAFKCLTKNSFKLKIWQIYQRLNTEGSSRLCSNDLVLVTDHIEFNDVSLNNDFKHLFTEFPYQIKFKRLPFFEELSEVIKPTVLFKNEEKIEFVLSSEQVNIVADNLSSGNNEDECQFQIRICPLINAGLSEVTDECPPGLNIDFNNGLSPLVSVNNPVSKIYIDCTDFIYVIPNIKNTMIIKRTPDKKSYVLRMCIVKKCSAENEMKKLIVNKCRKPEQTKIDIIRQLSESDPNLATKVYHFSLACPLTLTRIKIPARFIHCNHLECFDAYTFLKMNEKKSKWKCPICCKSYLYDDLQIDEYFWKIISSSNLKTGSTDIELLLNGTWNVCENTENNTHDSSVVICLDD